MNTVVVLLVSCPEGRWRRRHTRAPTQDQDKDRMFTYMTKHTCAVVHTCAHAIGTVEYHHSRGCRLDMSPNNIDSWGKSLHYAIIKYNII